MQNKVQLFLCIWNVSRFLLSSIRVILEISKQHPSLCRLECYYSIVISYNLMIM